MNYTLGLYTQIPDLVLLRKTCDVTASVPEPLWHGLSQLGWKPLSWSNPVLSMEDIGSPCPYSLGLLQEPPPREVWYLLNPRFPKPGILSFPWEQQWVCLVCLFLLKRGWDATVSRPCPASCSAEGGMNEQQLIQMNNVLCSLVLKLYTKARTTSLWIWPPAILSCH